MQLFLAICNHILTGYLSVSPPPSKQNKTKLVNHTFKVDFSKGKMWATATAFFVLAFRKEDDSMGKVPHYLYFYILFIKRMDLPQMWLWYVEVNPTITVKLSFGSVVWLRRCEQLNLPRLLPTVDIKQAGVMSFPHIGKAFYVFL